ncbi:Uncharacterised protein [Vibrio cholerae]|uniref:Uncharacterized protein n=1 Tax=Vibrio cholerae TaxID=666 RepID=A0A655U4Q8_VIBCL|nr:Uncharacterised protein [Vibrio cholerae]CRZ64908.1 Uncharacterised protein [Vibrio cholerae]CRZ85239.1 Uncharacterised protein [Vibrio cholerae]CSA11307.1 Uncharacterised protein [Vibrio cholerae]CSA54642.1 Uncharacterised protein [Vibrio cholerae]
MGEVFEVQIEIINAVIQFCRVVVTQTLWIQVIQVSAGFHKRTFRLRHFRAIDGHITMHKHVGRFTETRAIEHGRPEQAVEINDVFTDEMVKLGFAVFIPVFVKVQIATLVAQVFE